MSQPHTYGYRNRLQPGAPEPKPPRMPALQALAVVREEQPAAPPPPDLADLRRLPLHELKRLSTRVALAILEKEDENVPTSLMGRGMPRVVANIIRVAALEADVMVEDVLGPGRSEAFVEARHRAMASIRAIEGPYGGPRFSLSRIGRFFNRDHTTVHHAAKTFIGPLIVVEP